MISTISITCDGWLWWCLLINMVYVLCSFVKYDFNRFDCMWWSTSPTLSTPNFTWASTESLTVRWLSKCPSLFVIRRRTWREIPTPGGSQSWQKSEHKRPRVFPEPCEDSRQGSLHPHLRVCQHRKSSDYHPTKTFYHLVSERVKCSFVG